MADQTPKERSAFGKFIRIYAVIFAAAAVILFVGIATGVVDPNKRSRPARAEVNLQSADREAVKRELMTWAAVRDVHWAAAGSLWVGVLDDGTRRDGYAMSVCEVVRQKRVPGYITVTIIDIAKMAMKGERVELGKASCR